MAGVSRNPAVAANAIYRRLRTASYEVYAVSPGACPMLFLDPVDVGHRCIRAVSRLTGRLPKPVLVG